MERRLAAIPAIDVVGYSRLMEADEDAVISRQKAHRRELIDPEFERNRGRIVKTMGVSVLARAAVIVLLLFASFSDVAAEPVKISLAYCTDCVPFHFQDKDGRPAGLIIDLWRMWSEKTGIEIDFRTAPWDGTLRMVAEGRADAHAGLFFSDARAKFLEYGAPLTRTDTHFFVKKGLPRIETVEDIALFNCGGKFYATANTCIHRGGPLGEGLLEGTTVVCPWHGWEFDVASGACITNPKAKISTYPVKVEGNDLLVDLTEGS